LLLASEIRLAIGCDPEFVGPIGLTMPIIADPSVMQMRNFCCGANQNQQHYIDVNWERDLPQPTHTLALRTVKAGDLSPDGQGPLALCRGIEVGHIFQLGTKYSEAMHATVLNEQGKQQVLTMGCYGIGVSRIVAAAIEQHHDARGIVWPLALAPFKIGLIPLNYHKSYRVKAAADKLYQALLNAGFEVLLDDRKERPGVLFADMELIGIPHRLVLGERGLDANEIEYKHRKEGAPQTIAFDRVVDFFTAAN
jgi:prolyl-tRNA synthetase